MKFLTYFSLLFVALTTTLQAHDDKLGFIKGEHLNLVYADHVLAGAIADMPIYATPLKDKVLGLKLTHRSQDKDHESVFEMIDGEYVGTFKTPTSSGFVESILKGKVNSDEGKFMGQINGKEFSVQISSQTMDGHHYVNPKFEVILDNKAYIFNLEGGSACMGCATKISSVILTMLVASGKL